MDNPTRVNRNSLLKDGLCYYVTMLRRNGSVVGMYISTHFLLEQPVILLCILLSAGEGKHNGKHTSGSDSHINPILITIAVLEDKASLGISKIPILYTVIF